MCWGNGRGATGRRWPGGGRAAAAGGGRDGGVRAGHGGADEAVHKGNDLEIALHAKQEALNGKQVALNANRQTLDSLNEQLSILARSYADRSDVEYNRGNIRDSLNWMLRAYAVAPGKIHCARVTCASFSVRHANLPPPVSPSGSWCSRLRTLVCRPCDPVAYHPRQPCPRHREWGTGRPGCGTPPAERSCNGSSTMVP